MRDFTVDYLNKLNDQWKEIDCIINLAASHENTNIEAYNSLCRAAMVLCVSHMENFYKELAKNTILDIKSVAFKKLPDAMKKQFCRYFIGGENSKDTNDKVLLLVSELENHDHFPLSYEIFLPNKNKNPKPSVIESICHNLGTRKIFNILNDTLFDNVFSMTEKEIERLEKKVDERVTKIITHQRKIKTFLLKKENKNNSNGDRTLWESFFDNINTKRHDIAHGNIFQNSTSISELKTTKNKCKIFQKICIVIVFSNIEI